MVRDHRVGGRIDPVLPPGLKAGATRRNQRTDRLPVGISLQAPVRAHLQRFRRTLIPALAASTQTASMFTGSATPANDPVVEDGVGVAGRVPSARSAAYVNGRATRNALR